MRFKRERGRLIADFMVDGREMEMEMEMEIERETERERGVEV